MFSRTLLGPLVLAIGALSAVIEPEAVPPYGAGSDQVRWTHQESRIIDVEPEDLRPRWPRPHPHPPVTNTVYQDLTEVPDFSRILRLVNLNNATIDLLNSTDTNITFFAPPNSAFPKPRNGHNFTWETLSDGEKELSFDFGLDADPAGASFLKLLSMAEGVERGLGTTTDDKEKERRRRFIKHIVGAIVAYHVIPIPLSQGALLDNTTYATNLTIGHGWLDGEPLRVRVAREYFAPTTTVNLFSKILGPPLSATNGFIYRVSLPILPPPAVFQELFWDQRGFATTTSAIQRAGLTEAFERVYKPGKKGERGTLAGAGAVTVFAPTQRAFNHLPIKLRLFLYSPFGQRALKKLLAYHVVPDVILHSDYVHNSTKKVQAEHTTAYYPVPERPQLQFRRRVEDGLSSIFAAQAGVAFDAPMPSFESSVRRRSCGIRRVPVLAEPLSACCMKPVASESTPVGRPSFPSVVQPTPEPIPDYDLAVRTDPIMDRPPRRPHHPTPEVVLNVTLPTLLTNHTVDVLVLKTYQPVPPGHPPLHSTRVVVNGQTAIVRDGVANNGAVHVVGHLLHPFKKERTHGVGSDDFFSQFYDWEDWEDWLPTWAEEDD